MASIGNKLYSDARAESTQGSTPHERARNYRLADIGLMQKITSAGLGKNFGRQIGQAQARLDEFDQKMAATGRDPESFSQQEMDDFADDVFGGNTPSLFENRFSGMKRGSVIRRIDQNFTELQEDIQNELSNIANQRDFSGLNAEQLAREQSGLQNDAFRNRVESLQASLEHLGSITGEDQSAQISSLDQVVNDIFGSSPGALAGTQFAPEGTVRTESGFIGASDAPQAGAQGHTGETLSYNSQTGEITGTTTGTVYGTEMDPSAANALMTELQSGGTQDLQGAFDAELQAAYDDIQYQSDILDNAGVNYTGLTESEITDLEQVYSAAGQSDSLMQNIITMQEITDEDVQGFLDEATQFYTGEGSYYAQTFQRATENFQRELTFQAEERERALAMEKLQAAASRKQARAGLEASGMTFTGAGKELLGEESAFETDVQGLLQQEEDILTSSAQARFEKGIEDYGRAQEEYLGSSALAGIAIPEVAGQSIFGVTPDVRGSLEREQETNIQTLAQELQASEEEFRQGSLASQVEQGSI